MHQTQHPNEVTILPPLRIVVGEALSALTVRPSGPLRGRSCEGSLRFCPPPGPSSCGYCGPRAGRPGLGPKRKRLVPHFPDAREGQAASVPCSGPRCTALYLARRPVPAALPAASAPQAPDPAPLRPGGCPESPPARSEPQGQGCWGSRGAQDGYAPSAWARGSARYSGSSWCRSSSRPWARWACTWRNGRWPGRDPRHGGGWSRTSDGAGSQTHSCPGY